VDDAIHDTATLVAGPGGRHGGGVTVVADHLNNPRGLDLRHGSLYVA
jgi:hypothetical protein